MTSLQQSSWDSEGANGGRQWTYQTCTEFGWYQTTNQAEQKYGSSLPLEFFEQWCADAFGADITHEMLERSVANNSQGPSLKVFV